MKTNDGDHFKTYREQTRVKHVFVEKYIKAFFTVLGKPYSKFFYIDGFAGRGTYDKEDGSIEYGSPIRALNVITCEPNLVDIVTPFFIEKDDDLFDQLKLSVQEFLVENPMKYEPKLSNGNFNEKMTGLLEYFTSHNKSLPPTFLLVDPCGVDGASFDVLKKFLDMPYCEAFIFFNIDGLRRVIGLKNPKSKTLITLLGSEKKANELIELVDSCATSEEREVAILQYYLNNLKTNTKADFLVPFRVEFEKKRKVSHYLIHVTSHMYGFRIMKDVMWPEGKRDDGNGGLQLAQASINEGGKLLFDYQMTNIKDSIISILGTKRQVQVKYFTMTLVHRPENLISSVGYRSALLELENEGRIQVLDKDGSGKIAKKRPRNTLAAEYYVSTTF